MSYRWPVQRISLEHFSPAEFDHHELMDPDFLKDLDTLRMRCGFPIDITDDARTTAEHERLYEREIAKGQHYPKESPHLSLDKILVRCADMKPTAPSPKDGCVLSLEERELRFTYEVLRLHLEGRWKYLGLGIETKHWHVDDTPRLGSKRPAFWVAASR
jgi:hypothetical protein